MPKATITVPDGPRTGPNAPRTRHGRNRALVVKHWPLIAERRRLGFQLVDIWHELTEDPTAGAITYKAFRVHVREVAEAMGRSTPHPSPSTPSVDPRGADADMPELTPAPPAVSQKELFRLAREARQREAATPEPASSAPPGKPDMRMIDGGEVWMSILGRERVRELASLNIKLRSGEVPEADARPKLEAARREAWSKRLGIHAHQLTEEDMNGHW